MHLHEILAKEFERFEGQPLRIFETGTIRGDTDASRIGDGWSTLWFAEHQKRTNKDGYLVSIDLEIETCDRVLTKEGLRSWVHLIQGHSIDELAKLASGGIKWDIALLDSDNDSQLILHEYFLACQIVRTGGLILIDDCEPPNAHRRTGALKGELVRPLLERRNVPYRLHERDGWNGYRTGVIAIDI